MVFDIHNVPSEGESVGTDKLKNNARFLERNIHALAVRRESQTSGLAREGPRIGVIVDDGKVIPS